MKLSFIQDENAVEAIDGITYEFPYTMHERELTKLNGKPDQEFQIRTLLSQAWLYLAQEIQMQSAKDASAHPYVRDRAKSIMSFIHRHFAEDITLADMAAYAGVSTRECIRSFKHTFHQTPMDYLIHYRIEQAKRMLRETEDPVTAIAFMTGFHSSAYFSKIFKERVELTPKEYRRLK